MGSAHGWARLPSRPRDSPSDSAHSSLTPPRPTRPTAFTAPTPESPDRFATPWRAGLPSGPTPKNFAHVAGSGHAGASTGGGAGSSGRALGGGSGGGRGAKAVTWAALAATPSGTGSAAVQAAGTPRAAGQAKVKRVNGPVQQGVRMAVSKQIFGHAIGVDGPTQECWSCRLAGHYRGESPTDYGKLDSPLPGFTKDGDKVPGARPKTSRSSPFATPRQPPAIVASLRAVHDLLPQLEQLQRLQLTAGTNFPNLHGFRELESRPSRIGTPWSKSL